MYVFGERINDVQAAMQLYGISVDWRKDGCPEGPVRIGLCDGEAEAYKNAIDTAREDGLL